MSLLGSSADVKPDAKAENKPIEDGALSADDAFNFINDEETGEVKEDTPPKPKKEDKADGEEDEGEEKETPEGEEEDDELADLEAEIEELEEPSKDKLEVMAPPRRRDMLKKYPNLFKDFPYLEKAYYREQQFTKVFQDPEEASDALDKAETLARFEADIVGEGNQKNILKLIKDNNPKAFNKVIDEYLDNLAEVDEGAYYHVVAGINKQAIKAMWDQGTELKDLKLKEAAVTLNQFLFNSTKYKPHQKLYTEDPAEKKQQDTISERERGLVRQAFEGASSDVGTRVNDYFRKNIEANIDPKKSMTEYVRKNAVKDAIDKIQDLIDRDSRFKTLADRLWIEASKANFSRSSTDKIVKAFIARGKGLLAPVVRSARNEALRGTGRRVKEDPIEDNDSGEKPETERRRSSSKPKAKELPKGMSTLDALNSMLD